MCTTGQHNGGESVQMKTWQVGGLGLVASGASLLLVLSKSRRTRICDQDMFQFGPFGSQTNQFFSNRR